MDNSIYLNKIPVLKYNGETYNEILQNITNFTKLSRADFYLTQNGKLYTDSSTFNINNGKIQMHIRANGGKGGFGSMLRAIGAQIEKTTNKEACRDLSGRRLRDINEEKKLKAWLEKQKEREEEAKERKRRKLQRLMTAPKHEFKDIKYETSRSELVEKINDAVEEGFKKAQSIKNGGVKRKVEATNVPKKSGLWIGDDISSSSDTDTDTDSDSNDNHESKKAKINNQDSSSSSSSSSDEVSQSNDSSLLPTDDSSKPQENENNLDGKQASSSRDNGSDNSIDENSRSNEPSTKSNI